MPSSVRTRLSSLQPARQGISCIPSGSGNPRNLDSQRIAKRQNYRRALALLHRHRTKKEYTLFCQALAAAYPQAVKIRLAQDNLNIHDASAFYENLPADEAQALAERFAFSYTPRSASWLNRIEIEINDKA